jgi:hypothetical protein
MVSRIPPAPLLQERGFERFVTCRIDDGVRLNPPSIFFSPEYSGKNLLFKKQAFLIS